MGSSEQVDLAVERSPKSLMSNGVAQMVEDDSKIDSNSQKKPEHDHHTDQSVSINTSSNAGPDSLDSEKATDTENKPEQSTQTRGKKSNSSMKSTEPSDSSLIDDELENKKLPDHNSQNKDVPGSPVEDPSVEAAGPSENEKETSIKPSSPKPLEDESGNVAQSPSGSLPDGHSKKAGGRQKKKESLIKDTTASADDVSKKVSEATSDSEVKPNRRSGKKVSSEISIENKTTVVDASKKGSGSMNDSEEKPLKQSAKKVDGSSKIGAGSSSKQPQDKKRRARGKGFSEKDATKSSAKDDDKVLSY